MPTDPVHAVTLIHVPGDIYGPPLWGYQCPCGIREMKHQSRDFAVHAAESHGEIAGEFHHPPHPDMVPNCQSCYGKGGHGGSERVWSWTPFPRRWVFVRCGVCGGTGKDYSDAD